MYEFFTNQIYKINAYTNINQGRYTQASNTDFFLVSRFNIAFVKNHINWDMLVSSTIPSDLPSSHWVSASWHNSKTSTYWHELYDFIDTIPNKDVLFPCLDQIRNGDADLELSSSDINLEKQLFEYVSNRHNWVGTLDEGLQRMRESHGKFALLMPTYKARHLASRHCDLITYGHGLGMINYAFGFPAGSYGEALRSVCRLSRN